MGFFLQLKCYSRSRVSTTRVNPDIDRQIDRRRTDSLVRADGNIAIKLAISEPSAVVLLAKINS